MADAQKANQAHTATAPATATAAAPANGGATAARERKPREVPTIAINATAAEYAEVKGSLQKLIGGLDVNVPLGGYTLACALKYIRAQNK